MNAPELKPKIVCVDDDSLMLQVMAETLAGSQFDILKAENVDDAFDLVSTYADEIILVVCDYNLETKTGFDLRSKMLENHREIPFLLVSGNVSREVALSAVELKIAGFIAKPFQPKSLLEIALRESADRLQSLRDDLELLTGFVQESQALTEEIESLLLSFDDHPGDLDVINRIFACAHTIKGTSSFFKPNYVHAFTHRYEDYFTHFKRQPEKLDPGAVSVLLRGLDTIKDLITHLASRSRKEFDVEALASIFKELVTEAPKEVHADAASGQGGPKAAVGAQSDELRVSLQVLNGFMEKSGELTVLRNMINKVVKIIETAHPGDPQVTTLTELLSEMHKVNSSMQDQVTDLRKVPLKQVFKPLARVVRDLSASLGKKIEWQTRGEDLRVDHTLAEVLNKCLIHLIRNSADHGLEDAMSRQAVGKTPQGYIRVTAQEAQDRIVISVSDDGRGIDPEKIKSIAIKKGLLTLQESARLSTSQAQMLIFAPGFSTAEVITDVSGRGVGTDMVRGTIEALGGSIVINSEVGRGTEFLLTLPLPKSVLIKNSLFFRSGVETFGLDRDNVIRVSDVRDESTSQRIRVVAGKRFLESETGLLPLIDLSEVLGQEPSSKPAEMLVIIQSKRVRFCLCVEEVLDIEDAVIKKVGRWTGPLPVYEGASFLGDGRVGLILSADGLAEAVGLKEKSRSDDGKEIDVVREAKTETLLLFRLGERGSYATHQSEVYRVEEFGSDRLRFNGDQCLTIYNGGAMPLIDLARVLDTASPSSFSRELLKVIVVKKDARFFGFVVDEIRDFVVCAEPDPEEPVIEIGAGPVRVIDDKTVTTLNLTEFTTSVKAA